MNRSERILITGATGFIGQGLVEALKREEKTELWCAAENCRTSQEGMVHTVCLDFAEPFDDSLLPAGIDHIFHLAQFPDHRLFPEKSVQLFSVNTASTLRLLEYGRQRGAQSFIFTSSGNVYAPSLPGGPFREDDPVQHSDFYSLTKIASEMIVSSYRQFFPSVIFRVFACYGEGQQGRLIASLIERIDRGDEVVLHGEEGLSINPIHRDDAVEYMVRARHVKDSKVLNLGGEEILSIKEMAHRIGKALGREPRFSHVPGGTQPSLVGDVERLIASLGYRPKVGFDEGVSRMVQAMKSTVRPA